MKLDENTAEVASSYLEIFVGQPCLLTIVTLVFVFMWLIKGNNKHQEKMEMIRLKQFESMMKDKEKK